MKDARRHATSIPIRVSLQHDRTDRRNPPEGPESARRTKPHARRAVRGKRAGRNGGGTSSNSVCAFQTFLVTREARSSKGQTCRLSRARRVVYGNVIVPDAVMIEPPPAFVFTRPVPLPRERRRRATW